MPSLSELRARFAAANKTGRSQDPAMYEFWNMAVGASSSIRFVPWEDPITGLPYTERKLMKMKFVDPEDSDKFVHFTAPVRLMYEPTEKCPVREQVSALYREVESLKRRGMTTETEAKRVVATAHWESCNFFYQGFVDKSGFVEESVPENPIRIFSFTKKLHKRVMGSMMSTEDPFDKSPLGEFTQKDLDIIANGTEISEEEMTKLLSRFEGYNYLLKKGKQGEHANWDDSVWVKQSTSLTDQQVEALIKYGYHDLTKKLPDRPSEEHYAIMAEMMAVSLEFGLGIGDGAWNPEWTDAGLNFYRKKDKDADGEEGGGDDAPSTSSKGGSVRNQVAGILKRPAEKAADPSKPTMTASEARAKLLKNRAPVETKADEPAPEAVAEAEAETPKAAVSSKVASGVASIRDRMAARAKEAAAGK